MEFLISRHVRDHGRYYIQGRSTSCKKKALSPVVSKFRGFIVTILNQSSTKFQPGNFNRSYTTALTIREIMAAYRWRLCGVFANFLSF